MSDGRDPSPASAAPDSGAAPSGADLRAHPRRQVTRRAVIVDQTDGRSFSCTIIDLSLGGAKLQLVAPGFTGSQLSLVDPVDGASHTLRVVWRAGPFLGVAFTRTSPLPGSDGNDPSKRTD